jgi:hypothetical protein
MLRSEDPEARRIAVEGIGKKVGALAVEDLARAATDVDPRVRRAALRWLGEIKARDALPVITRRMRDPDEGARAAAAGALARIGAGDLVALGQQALRDKAIAVRLAGVEMLVAAKRLDLLATLAESDPDPFVAAEAALAIKQRDRASAAVARESGRRPRPMTASTRIVHDHESIARTRRRVDPVAAQRSSERRSAVVTASRNRSSTSDTAPA